MNLAILAITGFLLAPALCHAKTKSLTEVTMVWRTSPEDLVSTPPDPDPWLSDFRCLSVRFLSSWLPGTPGTFYNHEIVETLSFWVTFSDGSIADTYSPLARFLSPERIEVEGTFSDAYGQSLELSVHEYEYDEPDAWIDPGYLYILTSPDVHIRTVAVSDPVSNVAILSIALLVLAAIRRFTT